MNVKSIYTLTQKSFGGRVLHYNLLESSGEKGKTYGVEIALCDGKGAVEKQALENVCTCKESALKLIEYLYENAVGMLHFKDVVEDYIIA